MVLPARGGKSMASRPRNISEEHILCFFDTSYSLMESALKGRPLGDGSLCILSLEREEC